MQQALSGAKRLQVKLRKIRRRLKGGVRAGHSTLGLSPVGWVVGGEADGD